jgi:hypothetical protein
MESRPEIRGSFTSECSAAVRVAQSFLDRSLVLVEKEATEGLSKGRSAKCQARPVSCDSSRVLNRNKEVLLVEVWTLLIGYIKSPAKSSARPSWGAISRLSMIPSSIP